MTNDELRKKAEKEAWDVLNVWYHQERLKLDEKFKGDGDLVHSDEYKKIDKEARRKIQDIKKKYGI